jgi:hypothetical protein
MAGTAWPASARADGSVATEATPVQVPTMEPGHWTTEPFRLFASLRVDAGYLYLKPRLSLGYGRPFSSWAGVDLVPLVTPDYAGGYSGLHVQLDWFEVRAGARYVHAFMHQFLTPATSYNLVDLAEFTGHASAYLDLEAEAAAAIPAGPGHILLLGTASTIELVTSGYYVYDEALRVVVAPPLVYRGRVGYSVPFMPEHNARVGIVAEVIDIPNRGDQVYRAGLVAAFDIDDHLQAVANLLIPVYGPDSLGLLGADYTELGIRYRWATGHTHIPQERLPGTDETALARP